MERRTEEALRALLARAGIEVREDDIERFGKLLDTYTKALEMLHAYDVGEAEIGPTFQPQRTLPED